ncbi:hypothetical protein [Geosporobacter ferrireducens]|uniref:Glycerophosphoryl diester phosphodiesterase membrane domain-containing protein n=1 Tax=Geosporobacter ferrireducens TaxID=1424294 RepID=A0A1D8GPU1_9FIRM|nr:hypothetical protein [Geosporobacter ferrireducens]AOT72888.1 hypothetical protein Gferi_27025 [Geosporobacter ferrireducens]MTI55293.1 hypothetical protein [Geosporobacter ferrireducens]
MQEWFQEKITDAKVLDLSMEVYKKKFKSLIGYQFLFAIIIIVMMMAGGLLILPMLFWINLGSIPGFVLFIVLLIMGIGTLMSLNNVGIFHMTHSYINGEDISASEALGRAFSSFKYIFRIVGALAICLVPILFILGLAGVTTTAVTVFHQQMVSGILTYLLFNVLFLSFITAIIGSFLFYSLHIAVFDKEKGFASIKRSMQFAKGEVLKNAFRVLSISMFHWGVNVSVYASIAGAVGLLSFLFGKIQGGESIVTQMMLYSQKGRSFIDFVVGILLNPISPIIWTVYYINMKYKKEGLKINNMIESLEHKKSEELPENLDIHYE